MILLDQRLLCNDFSLAEAQDERGSTAVIFWKNKMCFRTSGFFFFFFCSLEQKDHSRHISDESSKHTKYNYYGKKEGRSNKDYCWSKWL